jgi:hypothetical protein
VEKLHHAQAWWNARRQIPCQMRICDGEISRIAIVDATRPQPVVIEEVELPGSPMCWIGHGAVTCGGWPGEKRKGPQHCFQHCGPEKRPLHC